MYKCEMSNTIKYTILMVIINEKTSVSIILQEDDYTVSSAADLGPLILVRLEKQKYWVEDNWFCRYVKVRVPGERCIYTFPCYRWLVGDGVVVELREGTGQL